MFRWSERSITYCGDQLDRVRGVSDVVDCTRDSACIVSFKVDIPSAIYHIHCLQGGRLKGGECLITVKPAFQQGLECIVEIARMSGLIS